MPLAVPIPEEPKPPIPTEPLRFKLLRQRGFEPEPLEFFRHETTPGLERGRALPQTPDIPIVSPALREVQQVVGKVGKAVGREVGGPVGAAASTALAFSVPGLSFTLSSLGLKAAGRDAPLPWQVGWKVGRNVGEAVGEFSQYIIPVKPEEILLELTPIGIAGDVARASGVTARRVPRIAARLLSKGVHTFGDKEIVIGRGALPSLSVGGKTIEFADTDELAKYLANLEPAPTATDTTTSVRRAAARVGIAQDDLKELDNLSKQLPSDPAATTTISDGTQVNASNISDVISQVRSRLNRFVSDYVRAGGMPTQLRRLINEEAGVLRGIYRDSPLDPEVNRLLGLDIVSSTDERAIRGLQVGGSHRIGDVEIVRAGDDTFSLFVRGAHQLDFDSPDAAADGARMFASRSALEAADVIHVRRDVGNALPETASLIRAPDGTFFVLPGEVKPEDLEKATRIGNINIQREPGQVIATSDSGQISRGRDVYEALKNQASQVFTNVEDVSNWLSQEHFVTRTFPKRLTQLSDEELQTAYEEALRKIETLGDEEALIQTIKEAQQMAAVLDSRGHDLLRTVGGRLRELAEEEQGALNLKKFWQYSRKVAKAESVSWLRRLPKDYETPRMTGLGLKTHYRPQGNQPFGLRFVVGDLAVSISRPGTAVTSILRGLDDTRTVLGVRVGRENRQWVIVHPRTGEVVRTGNITEASSTVLDFADKPFQVMIGVADDNFLPTSGGTSVRAAVDVLTDLVANNPDAVFVMPRNSVITPGFREMTEEEIKRFGQDLLIIDRPLYESWVDNSAVPYLLRQPINNALPGQNPTPGSVGMRFVAPLRPIEEVVDEVATNDGMVGWVAAHLGINPSVVRSTPVGKALTAADRQIVAAEELTEIALRAALDFHGPSFGTGLDRVFMGVSPFKIDSDGRIRNLRRLNGDKAPDTLWHDVFSYPQDYLLTEKQRAYIESFHRLYDEVQELRIAEGLEPFPLRELLEGEWFTPRQVRGADDIPTRGPSSPFASRVFDLAEDGFAHGIRYVESPRATMEVILRGAFREIVDKQLEDYLERFSWAPSDLVSTKVKMARDQAVKRYEAAKKRARRLVVSRDIGAAERQAVEFIQNEQKGIRAVLKTLRGIKVDEALKGLPQDIRAMVRKELDQEARLKQLHRQIISSRRQASEALRTAMRSVRTAQGLSKPSRDSLLSVLKLYKQEADALLAHSRAEYDITLQVLTGRKEVATTIGKEAIDNIRTRMDALRTTAQEIRRQLDDISDLLQPPPRLRTLLSEKRREANAELKAAYKQLTEARDAYNREVEKIKAASWLPGSKLGQESDARVAVGIWRNRVFRREDVELMEEWVNQHRKGDDVSWFFATFRFLGDNIRFLSAVMDFSSPFIHGLFTMATQPAVWARSTLRHFQAWLDPNVQARFVREHLDTIQEMAQYGVPIGRSEFFEALQTGRGISLGKLLELAPNGREVRRLLQFGGRQLFGRFQSSYDMQLLAMRTLLWESMRPSWKGSLDGLAQHIRNATGGLDSRAIGVGPKQRAIESFWLAFSPRLLRSTSAMFVNALQPGPAGHEARLALAKLATAVTGIYILTGLALGKDWNQILEGLNPANGKKFLAHEGLPNVWIGIGGQARAIVQLLVGTGMPVYHAALHAGHGDPQAAVDSLGVMTDPNVIENPILRFLSGRGAVGQKILGGTIEALSGGRWDALPYDEVDNIPELGLYLGTALLPFTAQNYLEMVGSESQRLTLTKPILIGATVAEGLGFRVQPFSMRDVWDKAAREEYGEVVTADGRTVKIRNFRELEDVSPVSAARIKEQYPAEPRTELQREYRRVRELREEKFRQLEEAYRGGLWLADPSQKSITAKWRELQEEFRVRYDELAIRFKEEIEGFDDKETRKAWNEYHSIIVKTSESFPEASDINWPETIKRREQFLNSLDPKVRLWIEEMLTIAEGRRNPLYQEFRQDMERLERLKYPFDAPTHIRLAFKELNPYVDTIVWRWFGTKLNSVEAVEQALSLQSRFPQPIKLSDFARRIDTDKDAWDADKAVINYYLNIDTSENRTKVLRAYPHVNATLVYWGYNVQLHTPQAAQVLDSFIRDLGWKEWDDAMSKNVLYYYTTPRTRQSELRRSYPHVDALMNMFWEFMFERRPVFSTAEGRRLYGEYTGKDVSGFHVEIE